jgi:hypothetical protein
MADRTICSPHHSGFRRRVYHMCVALGFVVSLPLFCLFKSRFVWRSKHLKSRCVALARTCLRARSRTFQWRPRALPVEGQRPGPASPARPPGPVRCVTGPSQAGAARGIPESGKSGPRARGGGGGPWGLRRQQPPGLNLKADAPQGPHSGTPGASARSLRLPVAGAATAATAAQAGTATRPAWRGQSAAQRPRPRGAPAASARRTQWPQ